MSDPRVSGWLDAATQEQLGTAQGQRFWRNLEELAQNRAFQEMMRQELSVAPDVWANSISRRKFLAVMGASLALAGLTGCSVKPAPSKTVVPYVHPPEEVVEGRPLFFASTLVHDGGGFGVLVESHQGRPTKIEGNPGHPASLGATTAIGQAAILTLYDPDRSKTPTYLSQTRTWSEAAAAMGEALARHQANGGAKVRILSEPVVSPTLAEQVDAFLKKYPAATWHTYDPIHRDEAFHASQMAFGQQVTTIYDFQKADVVVSLDDDFLATGPGSLRYTADFMARRRVRATPQTAGQATMNRLYQIETDVSCTGAKADHRLAVAPSQIERLARALAATIGVVSDGASEGQHERWIAAMAKDLQTHRGRSLVLAGRSQPAVVHLLAHALNDRLGNVGQTVVYTDPIEARPGDRTQSLRELTQAMERGEVQLLLVLGANPVYSAPADLAFARQMEKVPLRIHFGLYQDETSLLCHWHLPQSHELESWGDARAYDGTVSLVQPLIEPLYQTRSAIELLSLLTGAGEPTARDLVHAHWQNHWHQQNKPQQKEKKEDQKETSQQREEFEAFWQKSLHDGLVAGTALPHRSLQLHADWQKHLTTPAATPARAAASKTELELAFKPDPMIHDGRFANNAWLQECPKPISTLTWGNAVLMSPGDAARLDLRPGNYAHGGEHGGYHMPVLALHLAGRRVEGPLWIVPGHADGAVTVYLGYGRRRAGRVGGGPEETLGFDAYRLRTSERPWFAPRLEIVPIPKSDAVACTQAHHLMENREVVRVAGLADFQKDPQRIHRADEERQEDRTRRANAPLTLYKPFDYAPPINKWGMIIDLTTCIGCKACVVACQAENNIPVVGKEQVLAGREMHWLRVDRYVEGTAENPLGFFFQPLPCMHCEHAPCEYVCPTAATVHSAEGLNDMVYNRCVGTRFCSNNCPYKVRRFNFLAYSDFDTPSRRLQYNPDVTVRSRGVMEKCTYCVQRIRRAEIDAQTENRPIADGEVVTACQAACPAQAIVFGDLNDPRSQVAQWKQSPLEYSLLGELNTYPRTSYLAALRNPNPELETAQHGS